MTTDEIASVMEVIRQERATIAHYQALLKTKALRSEKVRWRALKKIHVGYIAKWQEELHGDQPNA